MLVSFVHLFGLGIPCGTLPAHKNETGTQGRMGASFHAFSVAETMQMSLCFLSKVINVVVLLALKDYGIPLTKILNMLLR
jgi:hypothetical protein